MRPHASQIIALVSMLSLGRVAHAAVAPIALGGAASFAVLGSTGVHNVGFTTVTGDLGSSPTDAHSGFGTITLHGTDHGNDMFSQSAQNDVDAAFNDALRRHATPIPSALGGVTLAPGVYESASGEFDLRGGLVLDGGGDNGAVFIIRSDDSLTTADSSTVSLIHGAAAVNVFWIAGGTVTLGGSSTFVGTLLTDQAITVTAGANVQGRLLSQTKEIDLDTCIIAIPVAPTPTPSMTRTPSETATTTASPTATPSETVTRSASPTRTASETVTASPTVTRTSSETATSSATPTASPSPSETAMATSTATPSLSPSSTPTQAQAFVPLVTRRPEGNYFYPSPVRGPTGSISYFMREAGDAKIKLYNQTGRPVDGVAEFKPAGWQSSTVSVDKFAAGTYYYLVSVRFSSGSTQTQAPGKFVVMGD